MVCVRVTAFLLAIDTLMGLMLVFIKAFWFAAALLNSVSLMYEWVAPLSMSANVDIVFLKCFPISTSMKGNFENGFPFVILLRFGLSGCIVVAVSWLLTVIGGLVGLKCFTSVSFSKSILCSSHCLFWLLGVVLGVLVGE